MTSEESKMTKLYYKAISKAYSDTPESAFCFTGGDGWRPYVEGVRTIVDFKAQTVTHELTLAEGHDEEESIIKSTFSELSYFPDSFENFVQTFNPDLEYDWFEFKQITALLPVA